MPEVVVIDWEDPCARFTELHRIYMSRLTTGVVKMVRTKSADTEREAQWYQGDMKLLVSEMQRAEDECRVKNGLQPLRRRFAITAGSRRSLPFVGFRGT